MSKLGDATNRRGELEQMVIDQARVMVELREKLQYAREEEMKLEVLEAIASAGFKKLKGEDK